MQYHTKTNCTITLSKQSNSYPIALLLHHSKTAGKGILVLNVRWNLPSYNVQIYPQSTVVNYEEVLYPHGVPLLIIHSIPHFFQLPLLISWAHTYIGPMEAQLCLVEAENPA